MVLVWTTMQRVAAAVEVEVVVVVVVVVGTELEPLLMPIPPVLGLLMERTRAETVSMEVFSQDPPQSPGPRLVGSEYPVSCHSPSPNTTSGGVIEES